MKVSQIIRMAFAQIYENRILLTKSLALPITISMVLDSVEFLETSNLVLGLASILSWAIMIIIAIITHRVVLLGADSVAQCGITKWTKREIYFAFYNVGIFLLLFLILVPLFIIALTSTSLQIITPLSIIAALFIGWTTSRLSLVFPSTAIDNRISLAASWHFTKNYQLLMFLIVVVLPILLCAPSFLIVEISNAPYSIMIARFFGNIAFVFEIAALSKTYWFICTDQSESNNLLTKQPLPEVDKKSDSFIKLMLAIICVTVVACLILFTRPHEPNWDVIADAKPGQSHPLSGFWKEDCAQNFGLAIGPMEEDKYYVSFCGPGGCFAKGGYRPATAIKNDDTYKIIDGNTLEVKGGDGFSTYHRCSWE